MVQLLFLFMIRNLYLSATCSSNLEFSTIYSNNSSVNFMGVKINNLLIKL